MKSKTRGNGYFEKRGNKIYAVAFIDGKLVKKSTGVNYDPIAFKQMVKRDNALEVLLQLKQIKENKPKEVVTTIKEFGYEVMRRKCRGVSENVAEDYMGIFENLIIPTFGTWSFKDLKLSDIEKWEENFYHLGIDRRRRIRNIFRHIISKAVGDEIIQFNPMRELDQLKDLSGKKDSSTNVYTPEEVALLLNTASGWERIYLALLFMTGGRVGEVLGLQWEDINFETKTIHFKRSWSKGKEVFTNKYKKHLRDVDIFPELFDMLLEYSQNKRNEVWLFTLRKNAETPPYSSGSIKKYILPIFEEAGVEYKTFRTARQSFITLMIENKMSLSWVQEFVGHKIGSRITMQNYFKSITKDKRKQISEEAANKVNFAS